MSCTDVKDATIDKDTLLYIMDQLDKDKDGKVTKDEFKTPWKKLFPKLTDADFDTAWKSIDVNGDGNLSLEELALHYGYNLSPNAKRAGSVDMSDEQILEALQMQAALAEMQAEQEAAKKAAEAAKAASQPASRKASSKGFRDEKKSSAGVSTIKMPSKVTQRTDDKNVIFLQMCELGEVSKLKAAIAGGQEVRIEDEKGEMPLHKLARQGCTDVVREILDKGAKGDTTKTDLNWSDKQGKTPIFYAAEYGHAQLVGILIDRGADVFIENNNGWTVLHSAVNADRPEVVSAILDHPKVMRDKKGLLEKQDKGQRVALHIASFKSVEGEMVKLLLTHGANAMAQDATGNTGAKLAGKTGRRKSKELLEEHMSGAMAAATK